MIFRLRDFAIAFRYEGLSFANGLSHLGDPPGPRYIDFIGCNGASADRTCGFAKVAEALRGFFHDLRSSVV